jgi:hypothetical protein
MANVVEGKRYSTKASGDEAKYVVKIAVPTNGWRPLTKEKALLDKSKWGRHEIRFKRYPGMGGDC